MKIYRIQPQRSLHDRRHLLRELEPSVTLSNLLRYTRQRNSVTGTAMRPYMLPFPTGYVTIRLIHFVRILFSRTRNNLCRGKTMDLAEPH